MNLIKYYDLLVNGYDRQSGILSDLPGMHYPIILDGEKIKDLESFIVELRDGVYRPFHMCPGYANAVSEELKCLLESYSEPGSIEFLPIKVISREYGDRTYYILHFTKIFDVIDKENTIYIKETGSILKPALDYEKVKTLHVFNYQPIGNDVIISEVVRKAMKKKKLDLGLDLSPVYCFIKDEAENF